MINFNIKTANNNETIDGFFLITNVSKDITTNGKQFLNIILSNKNGDINCKMWDSTDEDFDFFSSNTTVKIRAVVNEYKGNKQLIIKKYKYDSTISISELIATSNINVNECYDFILSTIQNFDNKTLRTITNMLVVEHSEKIKKVGAAKLHHHNVVSGWLEHTSTMLKNGILLTENYKNNINKDLLFAGIILHDIGKIRELKSKSYGAIEDYTVEGELLGHITLGIMMITECMVKLSYETRECFETLPITLLQHLILSHHGQPDFGSPKYPMTKEAELLSYLDMLDTKMNMFDRIISEVNENEFSQRQWSLDNRKIYHI